MAMAMSTQAKGLLLFLAVVTYASGARGAKYTYITNKASEAIVANISYSPGTSQFFNRAIAPGTTQSDEYSDFVSTIHVELWVCGSAQHVELWVDGPAHHKGVDIDADRSLVARDHGRDSTGVDIFLAKYGTTDEIEGSELITIFP